MNPKKFLTAEWRKLIMANYAVDCSLLLQYLPAHTKLDFWDGKCYVSLVGFMFKDVRVMGFRIPFHVNFPEVNLRFYVRFKENNEWKRGVVFINEIVPKPAISYVANTFFNERYITLPMRHNWNGVDENLLINYQWKKNKTWNKLEAVASRASIPLEAGSKEEFITEHFWGYTAINGSKTGEYHVQHPRWTIYPVTEYKIDCDFENLYGKDFSFLANQAPASVFLAEGSAVTVYNKRIISKI